MTVTLLLELTVAIALVLKKVVLYTMLTAKIAFTPVTVVVPTMSPFGTVTFISLYLLIAVKSPLNSDKLLFIFTNIIKFENKTFTGLYFI